MRDVHWTAHVEWPVDGEYSESEILALAEALAQSGGAFGKEKLAGAGRPSDIGSATISVNSPDLVSADQWAIAAIERMTGVTASAVEVLDSEEFNRRALAPSEAEPWE